MRASPASLLGLLFVTAGCPKAPPRDAGRGADAARADASVDAGAERRDPCAILEPSQRDLVVARVGGQSLTLCDFTRRVNSQNPYLRARFNAPEQRRALLQSWVDAELLAAEAQERGLDREPEVRRAVIIQLARRLEQSTRDAVPTPTVTDAEVRAYYEAHRAEYDTDAEVRASQIVLGSRADAERVLADVRAHQADDAYFRAQVRSRSVDVPSQARDGDLGFFPRSGGATVMPEVAEAAFAASAAPGDAGVPGRILDRVVESAHGGVDHGAGFHVIRLTARRDALHRSIDDEQQRIRRRLLNEKLNAAQEAAVSALLTRLRASTAVTIDEAALGRVRVDAQPQAAEGGAVAPPARMGGAGVPMPAAPRRAGQ
jgi:peptidyl-prolyl cis-trans isomerase C